MMRFYKEDYYMKNKQIIKVLSVLFAVTIPVGMFCVTANAAEYDPDTFVAGEAPVQGDDNDLPSSYSSVEQGYVTDIKNQRYNDCWAYSTLAALESKLLKEGYQTENMNETHLNLWAMTRSDGNGWVRSYTGAGLVYTGSGYLTSWQGGVLMSDAGNITITSDSKGDDAATDLARYGVTDIRYLSGEDRATIKRAIYENGAAVAAYSHVTSYYKDRMTYYLPKSYSGSVNGHLVTAVGWDDNYPKENFSTPPEHDGAWLMKNSWGSNNALGGYFWLSYEDKYVFSAEKFVPVYTIEGIEEITERKKLIQNEIYGAICDFDYIEKNNLTFLNRFDFDRDFFVLDKVIFETRKKNADYTIYLIPDENGAPTTDEAQWQELYRGKTDYAGYICADIDNIEVNGSASVGVKINSPDGISAIGSGEWLSVSGSPGSYFFRPQSKYGMSYIYEDGKMTDVMQWFKDTFNNDLGGTLVIKALTVTPETGDVNLDGKIDINDATLIQQYLAELKTLSTNQQKIADMDASGDLNINDATAIQIKIAE